MVVFNRAAISSYATAYQTDYGRSIDPVIDEISYLGELVKNTETLISANLGTIKRAFDFLFACISLILLLPVILVAAVLIKIESPGPIFFKQERIGLNRRRFDRRSGNFHNGLERRRQNDRRKNIHAGRPFAIYKLRTMRQDAEKAGPTLATTNDPRITRVGIFMRKTRIDEIPQFINVLKGEMSIIGPRPERSFFINQIKQEVPEFPLRLRVKPGITGLAQVEDGYSQSLAMMKNKILYDLIYIKNLSLMQELKILFKTVTVVLTGKGAC
ncbi:MAG: sugar transferase [Candidatus Krumholzibacteriota bacterium]|nr:sugar transferase [Candidatus Krumholzibacteriota bacterium]